MQRRKLFLVLGVALAISWAVGCSDSDGDRSLLEEPKSTDAGSDPTIETSEIEAPTTPNDAGPDASPPKEAAPQPGLTRPQANGTNVMPVGTFSLTFDDGPGARAQELADYLAARSIRAVFFVLGSKVASSNDATLKYLTSKGHLIANHSFSHPNLTTLSDADLTSEIRRTHDRIESFVPTNKFFIRAPYGMWNSRVVDSLKNAGLQMYQGSMFWDVGDTLTAKYAADWACWASGLATNDCGDRYLKEMADRGKGVILLHDIHSKTVDMVKYLVPKMVAKGYKFVRLDEVFTHSAGGAVGEQSCGDLTKIGRCEGNTLVRAINGVYETRDCAATGKVCSLKSAADGFDCVAAPTCGTVTTKGFCDGNRLVTCSGSVPKTVDCNLSGKVCGYANSSSSYACITF
jgi:peptidoglycan/xylan/chitin deacetylase (PgdA/CDA1 family)